MVPKQNIKSKNENVNELISKIRKEQKDRSNEQRYEIVQTRRGLNNFDSHKNDDEYNFVDLEKKEEAINEVSKYAYDLYVAAKQDFDISMLNNLVR